MGWSSTMRIRRFARGGRFIKSGAEVGILRLKCQGLPRAGNGTLNGGAATWVFAHCQLATDDASTIFHDPQPHPVVLPGSLGQSAAVVGHSQNELAHGGLELDVDLGGMTVPDGVGHGL